MADTEITAPSDTTPEIDNSTENKMEETNNNSEEMPQAAKTPDGGELDESTPTTEGGEPVGSQEDKQQNEKPVGEGTIAGQDAGDSKPASEENIPQPGGDAGEEATKDEPDAQETDGSPDAAPAEPVEENEPKQEEEPAATLAKSAEAKGDGVGEENTESKQEDGGAEERPKEESEAKEESAPERAVVEEGEDEQSSAPAEADAAAEEEKPVDAEAPAETGENVGEKAPEADAAEAKAQDQSADNEQTVDNFYSNEDAKQEDRVSPVGDTQEEHKQHTSGEPEETTPAVQQEVTPEEEGETRAEDPSLDTERIPTPVSKEPEPTQETAQEAQVSSSPEPAEEGLTGYELKYRAAQKDIEELRAMNVEIQQRLAKSEEEARERKQRANAESKDGMKVQADYLARELSQQQDTEKFLRQKLAEVLEEKEESERKCKDLQLRLKRFVKDDQAKDERMIKMEGELREISREVEVLEDHLDQETLAKIKAGRDSRATNGEATTTRTQDKKTETPAPKSKTCVIL
ncbi:enolase-phosphatase E1-like [Acanthaster planci]|uniref:Enolase-phosphatase E1-like n=1 Tax=Acanthaster planci TaxID=133434 RepID=A0A8B7YXC9_ACAPL|nr:enolase-phosphatase E1-like [Acanthaster planci]